MNGFIRSHWSKINAIFLISMFASILVVAYALLTHPDAWLIGDWLINYQGGFVRRGLSGEILLGVSSLTRIDLVVLTVLIQVSLCLIVFVLTFKLAKGIKPTVMNAALLFSPAFIQFLAGGFDGFRKEMLLFAVLGFHSWHLSRTKNEVKNGYLILLSVLFVFMVLSHEMLVVFLPYFLCGLYLQSNKLDREQLFKYTMLTVPAVLMTAVVVVLFKGDSQVVAAICASLAQDAPADCQPAPLIAGGSPNIGAIAFLALKFEHGRQVVANGNPPIGLMTNAVVLVLSMAPILYLFRQYEILKSNRYLFIFPGVAIIATLPLMLVMADYGRLISLHAICLTYVALQMLNTRREVEVSGRDTSIYAWLICLVFILGWRVVGYGASPSRVFIPLSIYKQMTNMAPLRAGVSDNRGGPDVTMLAQGIG